MKRTILSRLISLVIFFSLLFADCRGSCKILFADTFIYDSKGKKDPFAPAELMDTDKSQEEISSQLKLEGIIWDTNNPIAFINNKVVRVGDKVGNAEIINIKENVVILNIADKEVQIKLQEKIE